MTKDFCTDVHVGNVKTLFLCWFKYPLLFDLITTCTHDFVCVRFLTFISLWFCSASEWKVPTTFIYGVQDWMNYEGAQEARKHMKVPCEIIRVPQVPIYPIPLNSEMYVHIRIEYKQIFIPILKRVLFTLLFALI